MKCLSFPARSKILVFYKCTMHYNRVAYSTLIRATSNDPFLCVWGCMHLLARHRHVREGNTDPLKENFCLREIESFNCLCLGSMDDTGKQGLRLLLFPVPFQGHINPMIQLANILHSRGFVIHIIHTGYNFPNPSKYPHFTFHLLPDDLPDTGTSASDPIHLTKLLTATCAEPFRHLLGALLSDDGNNRFVCLITDSIWYFAQAAADKFSLPRIVLRTTSVCSYLALSVLPILQEHGYLSNRDSKTGDANASRIIHNMVEETKKAAGLIFNTFTELEEPELAKLHLQFPMPTFAVGPFQKYFSSASTSLLTQDRSSVSWLDEKAPKSVLYVSFGSMVSMEVEKVLEVAWGLANSMHSFLWVVRPGLVHGSEWIEMLPKEFLSSVSERSHIVKWSPQQEVLYHPAVGGFWTHCGWNSTLESMCAGVPMMCSPFFGDQMMNARYVSDVWKIGIKLEKGMEREEIEDAIRTLMVSKRGEEMRKRVVCLREKIDICLNTGGSSYRALEGLIGFITSFESSH